MYINQLFDAYKKAKNYVQDKQIAHDLGLDSSRISEMRKGKRQVTDSEAVILAEVAGVQIEEVLLRLAADRAKDEKAQRAWQNIVGKLLGRNSKLASLAGAGILTMGSLDLKFALCILC
ncbi:hypothetical protein CS022_04600 [Veronia nyctiphanis]|uniref:HTH cro/C1-type domain-containing protein n=1 Tax=Veronia nyctiphanis TaxID=1278244 RepID=A0A4Q0YU92_9GAMM|nr:DUF3693 domain-containing protein [Veronia nyctiphanis]RXJ74335.1 hypothetical protein CS022_04600 [Veronia nyctiphanis]